MGERDDRRAVIAPFSRGWFECRFHSQIILLLCGRELCHSPIEIRAERREYLAADAEIGVIHVRSFFGFGKTKGNFTKFVCCHYQ